jgi:phospholipase C
MTIVKGYTNPQPVGFTDPYDLDHSHWAFRQMCDNNFALNTPCRMDGAARVACTHTCPSKPQYRYVDNSAGVLNPYLDIATQYGWANYMFQTNQGASFPAHMYLFGGTSAPTAADDAAGIFIAENTPGGATSGCIADMNTRVALIKPPQNENTKVYPCADFQTMGDFQQTFSWRYYTPSEGFYWTAPTAISHICKSSGYNGQCLGPDYTSNVDLRPADVLTDIAGCNLRDVSWVIPGAQNSDHADFNAAGGPSWVASIVNAVGKSNKCDGGAGYWEDTAIFITWDDWGGWYDHEAPPLRPQPQSDYEWGFRVPLLVVSAYTPAGYIDNSKFDFGSMIRFVEQNFGLQEGVLGFADARANNNMTSFFRSANAPRTFKTIPSRLDATYFINDKSPQGDPDTD